jgi:hypothetical protein
VGSPGSIGASVRIEGRRADQPRLVPQPPRQPDRHCGAPGSTFAARAVVAEGDERERVWTEQKSRMPGFADYEQKTTRTIPVIALEPVA